VIGQGHGVTAARDGELDQGARSQQAVRGNAVIVQVKILQFISNHPSLGKPVIIANRLSRPLADQHKRNV
jgi:hypothetical protein